MVSRANGYQVPAAEEGTSTAGPWQVAVTKFVDNVDNEQCRDFISGTTWARPMGSYAPYAAWQLAALPAGNASWTGGPVNGSQADECAAAACYRCYCLSLVSLSNMNELVQSLVNGEKGYCDPIYKQIRLEAGPC